MILKRKIHPTTKQIFTYMVLFMWAASFLMDMANPKYDPPIYINPRIMLVGAYFFATSNEDKDKKESNDSPANGQR